MHIKLSLIYLLNWVLDNQQVTLLFINYIISTVEGWFSFQVAPSQSEAASPRQRAGAGRHTRRFECLLAPAP